MTSNFSRGQQVFLVRPKRLLSAIVISAYEFPAVRIRIRGVEKIVGRDEVVSAQRSAEIKLAAKKKMLLIKHAALIAKWKPGMTSSEWRAVNRWRIGDWSALCSLKRWGLIE